MLILDRHILTRFFVNFGLIFVLLFVFAITIDVILKLDKFFEATTLVTGEDATRLTFIRTFLDLVMGFQVPRIFQFYAFLHGLVAIGAMGFTLGAMHRHKELVAILASGTSLLRVAVPFIIAIAMISVVQMVNQEAVLPRVAPLLLRDDSQIGRPQAETYAIPFTPDGTGGLLQAPSFNPTTGVLNYPTILERDETGRTIRRIAAELATWDESLGAWQLEGGEVVTLESMSPVDSTGEQVIGRQDIKVYETAITPRLLIVRHNRQFASMLSMNQIRDMIDSGAMSDDRILTRHWYARFTTVPVNVLVLLIALPSFLLREPRQLLPQSIKCAAIAIPALIGAAIGQMVDLPGIPGALSVFLPTLVLLPVALARVIEIKT